MIGPAVPVCEGVTNSLPCLSIDSPTPGDAQPTASPSLPEVVPLLETVTIPLPSSYLAPPPISHQLLPLEATREAMYMNRPGYPHSPGKAGSFRHGRPGLGGRSAEPSGSGCVNGRGWKAMSGRTTLQWHWCEMAEEHPQSEWKNAMILEPQLHKRAWEMSRGGHGREKSATHWENGNWP